MQSRLTDAMISAVAAVFSVGIILTTFYLDWEDEKDRIDEDVDAVRNLMRHDSSSGATLSDVEKMGSDLGVRQKDYFAALLEIAQLYEKKAYETARVKRDRLARKAFWSLLFGARTTPTGPTISEWDQRELKALYIQFQSVSIDLFKALLNVQTARDLPQQQKDDMEHSQAKLLEHAVDHLSAVELQYVAAKESLFKLANRLGLTIGGELDLKSIEAALNVLKLHGKYFIEQEGFVIHELDVQNVQSQGLLKSLTG